MIQFSWVHDQMNMDFQLLRNKLSTMILSSKEIKEDKSVYQLSSI